MKKIGLNLLFLLCCAAMQAQNTEPIMKNELSISLNPLWQRENVQQFGFYRRFFEKNALRVGFGTNTFQTNPNSIDLENTTFSFQDSAFSLSKSGSYGGGGRLSLGYERHFLGKYPAIDWYIGADVFGGFGEKSFAQYVWNFQQQASGTYSYTSSPDDPVVNKVSVFQAGISPLMGLNVGIGKRFYVGGEIALNAYQEWQKNTKKYPEYRFSTFNLDFSPRVMMGLRF